MKALKKLNGNEILVLSIGAIIAGIGLYTTVMVSI